MEKYKTLIPEIKMVREKRIVFKEKTLNNPKDVSEFARKFWHEDISIYESAFIIMVNSKLMPIAYAKISQGGVHGTVIDVKIIAKYVISTLASGIIMIHNHPSGNINPSDEDKKIAHKVKETMSLLDVSLVDNMIITEDDYFSFKENDLL